MLFKKRISGNALGEVALVGFASLIFVACGSYIVSSQNTPSISIGMDGGGNRVVGPSPLRVQIGDKIEICNELTESVSMLFFDTSSVPGPFSKDRWIVANDINNVILIGSGSSASPTCVVQEVRSGDKGEEFEYIVVTDKNQLAYPDPLDKVSRPKIIIMG